MTVHQPILLPEIIEYFSQAMETDLLLDETLIRPVIVDCTFGGGGHTGALLEMLEKVDLEKKVTVIGVDQDEKAIQNGIEKFKEQISAKRLELHHIRMSEFPRWIEGRSLVGVLADLGFSSDQLEDSKRGLSFKANGPLDMRLNPHEGLSAAELITTIDEQELERILREYGEERFSKQIARAIIASVRDNHPPETTQALVQIVVKAIPSRFRHGKIHAATRTFQALRIAVNEELDELDELLGRGILNLVSGGIAAIMSFHSLEDRRVKHAFRNKELFEVLTKKPIIANKDEMSRNPRSRSAKLRVARRKPS